MIHVLPTVQIDVADKLRTWAFVQITNVVIMVWNYGVR